MPSRDEPRANQAPAWSKLTNQILDLVFPPRCAGCGRLGYWFCDRCQAQIEPVDPQAVARKAGSALAGIYAIGYFDGRWRKAIHAFKYSGRHALARTFAEIQQRYLETNPLPGEVIVPVPLHKQRFRERGYNQAALLAGELGILLGKEVDSRTLLRERATRPQVGMSEADRLRNVAGAFVVSGYALRGKSVLLIDDVATTGATLEACAQALGDVGANPVWGLVLAKER